MTPLPPPIRFEAEDHSWWVAADIEEWVRDALVPMARTPEALDGAEVFKSNRIRTVARVPAPGGALFIKRFRAAKRSAPWQWAVKGTPARREWNALRRLRAAGLDCPEAVVLAEERRRGLPVGAVLATREVPGCEPVRDLIRALRESGDLGGRERLTRALAEAAWTIFCAGVDHPDMHLGNFLVRPDGSLVTLDLHSVRLLGSGLIPKPIRRRRLGKLVQSLGAAREVEGAEDLVSFARAYAGLDHALGPASRLEAELVARAQHVEAVRRLSRDKRCVVNSSGYAVERSRGKRVYRVSDVTTQAVLAAWSAPPAATVHAHPYGRSLLELIDTPPGVSDAPRVLRKTYRHNLGVFGGAALRAWKGARACRVRKIQTPTVYALVQDGGLFPTRAAIIMEHVDARMLHHLVRADPPLSPAARQSLARDLGALLARFHATGLSHGDLTGQNLLARPGPGGGWELWLLDHEEVRVGSTSRSERVFAFVQLGDMECLTRTDRARFFRAYLRAGGEQVLASELKAWGARGLGRYVAAGIAVRAAERTARHAARDKPPRPPAA